MTEETKGCLSGVSGCAFAIWGFVLNAVIGIWLMRMHFNFATSPRPMVALYNGFTEISDLLGLTLGFITGILCVSKNAVLAWRSGWTLLILTVGLILFDLPNGARLMFDTYAFSVLWALSLIAIGYILRSRPKSDAT